jgi:hypothetical protein
MRKLEQRAAMSRFELDLDLVDRLAQTGRASSVRTSPTSTHSSAMVLSGNVSGIVVRVKSVVKRGRTALARPCRARGGRVSSQSAADRIRVPCTGHSNSARELMPPALTRRRAL